MAIDIQEVEFKTIDGLTLRGDLYNSPVSSGKGPAVIITPGFNCVKEMFVPDVAEQFQKNGITALIYDPRTLGLSDGLPRNDIDPARQVSDYSDAVTFVKSLPNVDPSMIGIWGMSFSGVIALSATALDPRIRFCIAICPLLNLEYEASKFPKVLAKLQQDRESQLTGNKPLYVPVLTAEGKNPAGMGLGADKEEFDYMVNAKSRGAPRHENHTTFQSYYKIKLWQPQGIMRYLDRTPVLMVVPELDQISPPEAQIALHGTFPEPKVLHIAPGKGHLDVLSGDDFPMLSTLQADFVKKIVAV
ncbi:Alpha/Beta hydrolase protein [Alternaria rosae]|uniref:Alpha/Beta hydrolase protein n=1 Tax=Alternaria rosae TaxID=1187941 RepID=UPI001E8DF315|nr:Alpha/Beta hydrolase protein [Alternaria rosae]KAH6883100.1 Alpha/Beta hydrolase protein [Alternaria rosae]